MSECGADRVRLHPQAAEMRRQLTRLGSAPAHWRNPDLPTIYVITPTHAIPTQKADLVR